MYQALYRKWRPRQFADVVGQEGITTALANQIVADKIGHAYLFTGTRGTGKTTCAKLFAKAVNCEDRSGAEPCGSCPSCLGMEDGSILDVVEIDAASNNSVDDVRDLRDETAFRPSRSRFRVYIIDEVHMLSTSAFNALLKILEEPPSHVIFILATTEIHKVPATILSRCQRFDFMRIGSDLIAGRLLAVAREEGIELTEGAAALTARLADGAMRDALSLLDTCAGLGKAVDEALVRQMAGVADREYLFAISAAVQAGDTAAILAKVAQLREKSIDVRRLSEELVQHYRNFLLAVADPAGALLDGVVPEEQGRYLAEAPTVGEAFAIDAVRRLAGAVDKMGRSPDPRIELELALFDLAERAAGKGAPAPTSAMEKPVIAKPAPPPAVQAAPPGGPAAPATPPPQPAVAREPAAEAPAAPPPEETAAPAPEPAPEPEQPPAPTPEPPAAAPSATEGAPAPFEQWPAVMEKMAATDRMLFAYMKDTGAYFDGKRVLISGGEMFLTFMRDYANASETIKAVIEQVTGRRYGIGPYKPPEGAAEKQVTAQDTLKELQELGVEVIIE